MAQHALTGLWRGLTGCGIADAPKRTVLAQLLVTLVPGSLLPQCWASPIG